MIILDKEKLQQHLNRIEKETARLEGERRMLIHLAKEEGIIDEQGQIIQQG